MTNRWPTTEGLQPVIDADRLRRYLNTEIKQRWGDRVDATMRSRDIRTVQLAALTGSAPQTIDKVRKGQIVPREYLRIAIAMALGCEVADLFPLPSRADLAKAAAA